MGYTHYFNNVPTNKETWNSFYKDVEKVLSLSVVDLDINIKPESIYI